VIQGKKNGALEIEIDLFIKAVHTIGQELILAYNLPSRSIIALHDLSS